MPPTHLLRCLQAFAPFPAERLDEIGGGRAAYIQDPAARREQGEARKARALEPGMFGGWCSEVRWAADGSAGEVVGRWRALACQAFLVLDHI